ncbi:MAG: hypothetical protein AAF488_04210 [Planctomycetota bacterium]
MSWASLYFGRSARSVEPGPNENWNPGSSRFEVAAEDCPIKIIGGRVAPVPDKIRRPVEFAEAAPLPTNLIATLGWRATKT